MPALRDSQRAFARAILDPDLPVPMGLVDPEGMPDTFRFRVYRNNVVMGLINILKSCYPAVTRLVGDEFFGQMAGEFVRKFPPRSPILLQYGGDMADFIATFPPCAEHPFLADVARIEWAYIEAHHAVEARPLVPSVLADLPAVSLPRLRLELHPSLRLVSSPFAALSLWQSNSGPEEPDDAAMATLDLDQAEDVLVCRPQWDVELRCLPEGAATFIAALNARRTIGEAYAEATEAAPNFDLAATLAGLFEAGAIIDAALPASSRRTKS